MLPENFIRNAGYYGIWHMIVGYLNLPSLAVCRFLNKDWKDFIDKHPLWWYFQLLLILQKPVVYTRQNHPKVRSLTENFSDWKMVFKWCKKVSITSKKDLMRYLEQYHESGPKTISVKSLTAYKYLINTPMIDSSSYSPTSLVDFDLCPLSDYRYSIRSM